MGTFEIVWPKRYHGLLYKLKGENARNNSFCGYSQILIRLPLICPIFKTKSTTESHEKELSGRPMILINHNLIIN